MNSETMFLRFGHVISFPDLSRGSYEQFVTAFCIGLHMTQDLIASLESEISNVNNQYNLLRRYVLRTVKVFITALLFQICGDGV